MRKTIIPVLVLIVLAISGCVTNPYTSYYHDFTGGIALQDSSSGRVQDIEPVVKRGSDPLEDAKNMMRNGYLLLGESSFNSAAVADSKAVSHARRIGAEVVLLYSQYTNTVTGSVLRRTGYASISHGRSCASEILAGRILNTTLRFGRA